MTGRTDSVGCYIINKYGINAKGAFAEIYKQKFFKGELKMKKFKKLVPAFCMLLLSAVMLASGTYAWFSVNDRVSATGMEVTAEANTKFLVIKNELTGGKFVATGDDVTAAFKKDTASGVEKGGVRGNGVYPVFKATTANIANINVVDGSATLEDGKWYTANSTKYDVAADTEAGKKLIRNVSNVTLAPGDYFLHYTAYVGLAVGSQEQTGKTLKLTLVNEMGGATALPEYVKYLVKVTTSGTADYVDGDRTAGNTFTGIDLKAATDANGTDAKFVTVEVLVYIDGFHDDIKDTNVSNISGKLGLSIVLAD